MKKILAVAVIMLMTIMPVKAYAADGTTVASTTDETSAISSEAGITPDSVLYPLDKLVENVQLSLTSDPVDKAALLDADATERLGESEVMVDEDKTELGAQTLDAYQQTLDKASDEVDQAIQSGEDVTAVVNQLSDSVDSNAEVVENVESQLPADQQDAITQNVDDSTAEIQAQNAATDLVADTETSQTEDAVTPLKQQITQKVLASVINDQAVSDKMTEAGLNTRQILAIKALADASGKSISDVLDLFLQNNKGIGATAKALGLTVKVALGAVNKTFKENIAEIKVEFKNAKASVGTTDEDGQATDSSSTAVTQPSDTTSTTTTITDGTTTESSQVQSTEQQTTTTQGKTNKSSQAKSGSGNSNKGGNGKAKNR